jgi:glycosyltransferase involved in cell wall biosynthesis
MADSETAPKISVVTVSLNQGRYIEDCIRSVQNQGFSSFEHVIVDAGSTDETLDVLKAYPHLRWVSEPDEGQSDGLNKGFRRARAEWSLWLNSDDYLLPGALEAMYRASQQSPSPDLIYGHTVFVDGQRRPIRTVYQIKPSYGLVVFGLYLPPSTGTLFRTRLLKENPLAVDFNYIMDVEWVLRCGTTLNYAVVDRPLTVFRVSGENKTAGTFTDGTMGPEQAAEHQATRSEYVFPWWQSVPQLANAFYRVGQSVFKFELYPRKLAARLRTTRRLQPAAPVDLDWMRP